MNGIILHELYFGNLGQPAQGPNQPSDALKEAITREYGSWQAYLTHLRALGKSMRGWVLSAFNIRDGRIHNYGLDTHNQWVPIHVIPFIVLDVYEHAYMLDFGTNRGSYLDVFFNNHNWPAVNQRFASLPFHGT
jgi:Fe-Mn family superoxide dismutase